MVTPRAELTGERADLLAALDKHRGFLRYTVRGLTDEQAEKHTTVSQLTLGGLIKHVAGAEEFWMRFAVGGVEAMRSDGGPPDADAWAEQFRMMPGETLDVLLERYRAVAEHTDGLVSTLDLDSAHPLPSAPWFEPGAVWSVRRVLLHIVAETAQHAGHADIIREALDGQRTMG
ncbi:DinB family protein [Kitasatospora sp. NPDC092948]|uniref:DinB family protein n=1 Tax=Kitasatospora sp. NPDC092948 TaxID=3364088 RepID=UPI00382C207B